MSFDALPTKRSGNKILSALPKDDLKRLKTKLEPFDLTIGANINVQNQLADYIYFPDSGIISLLGTLGEGADLQIGIVSNYGAVPLCPFLGTPSSPVRAVVQGSGFAQRIKTSDFLDECRVIPQLTTALLHFTRSLMLQISQCSICFRFHNIEERLARWLLMSADCMISNEFHMTHDSLSHMLGVRREGVTIAASHLQKQKIIRYSRGNIEILDRKALELSSCPCYAILKQY